MLNIFHGQTNLKYNSLQLFEVNKMFESTCEILLFNVYRDPCTKLQLVGSQANDFCFQINVIGFKIPTGGVQTS